MQKKCEDLQLDLESKVKELSQVQDSSMRNSAELEKLNALLEQKLQLTQQENLEQKTKIFQKDQQIKELNRKAAAT